MSGIIGKDLKTKSGKFGFPGYTGGTFAASDGYESQSNAPSAEQSRAGHVINCYQTTRGTSSVRNSNTPTSDGVYIEVNPVSKSSRFLITHTGYGYYGSGSDGTVYLKVFRHIADNPARGSATDITENVSTSTGTAYSSSVMNGYLYQLSYNDFTFKLDWQGMDWPNTTTRTAWYIETTSNGLEYRYPQGMSFLTLLELAG